MKRKKNRLAEWLFRKGYQNLDLAKKLNVSEVTVSRWTTNKVNPSEVNSRKICNLLKVKEDELYYLG